MLSSNDRAAPRRLRRGRRGVSHQGIGALLSTPALLKLAVIGLDANIDDVALIEEADKAEDEETPDDAPDGESEDAVRTGGAQIQGSGADRRRRRRRRREQLADALRRTLPIPSRLG